MDESPFESESESLRPCCLSVGPIHPKLWEHWAWAGLGLGLLLLYFLLWAPPASMVHAQVAPSLPLLLLPLLCLSFLLMYLSTDLIESLILLVFYLLSHVYRGLLCLPYAISSRKLGLLSCPRFMDDVQHYYMPHHGISRTHIRIRLLSINARRIVPALVLPPPAAVHVPHGLTLCLVIQGPRLR